MMNLYQWSSFIARPPEQQVFRGPPSIRISVRAVPRLFSFVPHFHTCCQTRKQPGLHSHRHFRYNTPRHIHRFLPHLQVFLWLKPQSDQFSSFPWSHGTDSEGAPRVFLAPRWFNPWVRSPHYRLDDHSSPQRSQGSARKHARFLRITDFSLLC